MKIKDITITYNNTRKALSLLLSIEDSCEKVDDAIKILQTSLDAINRMLESDLLYTK